MMRKLLKSTFSIILLLMIVFQSAAQESEGIYKIQQRLEKRISSIVKSFDKNSSVIVKIRKKKRKVKLPLTPYTLRAEILSINGKLKLRYMKVSIITSMDAIPLELDEMIREVGSDYGIRKSVQIKHVKVLPTKAETPLMGLLSKDFELKNQQISNFFKQEQKWFIALGIGLMFILVSIVLSRANSNKLKRVLEEQMSRLNSSIEGLGGFSGKSTASKEESHTGAVTQIEVNNSSDSIWEKLESESLKAIFFDCYWCENDTYAKFIWQKIPIEQKISILNSNHPIRDYAHYIVELGSEDLNYVHDPYYLDPLDVNHLDNEAVSNLLKKNPAMLNKISKMRLKKLDLRAIEYLKLVNTSSTLDEDISLPCLKSILPSLPRELKLIKKFVFKSTEEEQEIINQKDHSYETISCFPSLAWGLKLNTEDLQEILLPYTAKELANAWIAPEETLIEISHAISAKKLDLLNSYKDSVDPSRQSDVYLAITTKILDKLQNIEGRKIEKSNKKAAA